VPFGVTYEKIGTIQRRLAWPLHKDDTLSRSGRSTDLNIYFFFYSTTIMPSFSPFFFLFSTLNHPRVMTEALNWFYLGLTWY
ncbi:hypothetical protein B0H34DRAFT_662656, partial [Crassisporium funariophilum]